MSNLRSIGFALLCWISISTSTVFAEKYGVVVGVEKYDTSIFHNLRYANEDAAQLAAELEKLDFRVTLMHGDRENARLIPSSPRKILRSIQSTIDACETGDTLLISLSGHGVQFIDEQPLPSGIRETYFCPSDAELSDKESLIPISEIYRRMNASSASRKLLLVDACQEHRLSAAGRTKSAKRLRAASVHENRRSVPGGMSVLFSCKNGQFSWEDDELKHGVFTYHVLRYLRGQAAPYYYEDRRLELNSLVSYVARATNNYVRDRQLCPDGQYPVLRGTASNWSLGHVSTIEDRAYRLVQQYLDAATPQALNAEDPTQSAARSLQIEIGRIAAGLLLLDVSPTIDQIDQLTDQYNKAMDAIQEPKMAEQFAYGFCGELIIWCLLPESSLTPRVRARLMAFVESNASEQFSLLKRDLSAWPALTSFARTECCSALLDYMQFTAGEDEKHRDVIEFFDGVVLKRLAEMEKSPALDRYNEQLAKILRAADQRVFARASNYGVESANRYLRRLRGTSHLRKDQAKFLDFLEVARHCFPGADISSVIDDLDLSTASKRRLMRESRGRAMLLLITHCDCGTETAAYKALQKFETSDRGSRAGGLVLTTQRAFTKMESINTEGYLAERPARDESAENAWVAAPWYSAGPMFFLFDDSGKLLGTRTGMGDSTVDFLESAFQ